MTNNKIHKKQKNKHIFGDQKKNKKHKHQPNHFPFKCNPGCWPKPKPPPKPPCPPPRPPCPPPCHPCDPCHPCHPHYPPRPHPPPPRPHPPPKCPPPQWPWRYPGCPALPCHPGSGPHPPHHHDPCCPRPPGPYPHPYPPGPYKPCPPDYRPGKRCCRCYNYQHACVCYKKTHPGYCNKCKSNTCFCHDYPGHFGSVCYANPCDPDNNCCNVKEYKCKSYKNCHEYNCCPSEKGNPYYVRGKCPKGLVSYNTYTYFHKRQLPNDYDLIDNRRHYRHRCPGPCNCRFIACTDCHSYYYCSPNKEAKCPHCFKIEPSYCCKCKHHYVPCKKYKYCCPLCYNKNKSCFLPPPSYNYWKHH